MNDEWNCVLMGSDDVSDQLSLTLRWVPAPRPPRPTSCSCRSAASLQCTSAVPHLPVLPLEIFYLFVASIPPSCPPLANLFISKSDCTFLSLPLTPGPPSPFHNTSWPFFCQRCPICLSSSSFFLYPDVWFLSPSSFFFSLQPSQSQQSPSSYHHGPCVFSKVPLRPTLIQ